MKLMWTGDSMDPNWWVYCFDDGGPEYVHAVEDSSAGELLILGEEERVITNPAHRREIFESYRAAGGEYAMPGGCEMEREEQAA